MALPPQIGDDVIFQTISLASAQAQPLVPGAEKNENVCGILIIADIDNTDRVFVGDSNLQPIPLAAAMSIEFKISNRRKLYVRGPPGNKIHVATVLTSGCPGTSVGR